MADRSARHLRRAMLSALLLAPALLAGCSEAVENNGQNSLEPKGPAAQKIMDLYSPVVWIAAVIGVGVLTATVVFALKFRHRAGADDNPKQVHGNSPLEISWTLAPAVILAVIAVPTVSLIFNLAEKPQGEVVEVEVVAKQWWWEFKYPGQEIVTANELVVPAGAPVRLTLRACDPSLGEGEAECNVIHSFWVPELAGKTDVVPGRDNKMTIEADEPGTFLGQCAEYCGLSHANMRFRVIAKTPADFEAWVREQQGGPAVPFTEGPEDAPQPAGEAQDLIARTFGCTNCHTFDDPNANTYGPNLTHLASRTTFASGYYELTRDNLVRWILDAPSMVPMQVDSPECRAVTTGCVGMPSFVSEVPDGAQPMTREQAGQIADYLLQLK